MIRDEFLQREASSRPQARRPARLLAAAVDLAAAAALCGLLAAVVVYDRHGRAGAQPLEIAVKSVAKPEPEGPPPLPEIKPEECFPVVAEPEPPPPPPLASLLPPVDPLPRLQLEFNRIFQFGVRTRASSTGDAGDDGKRLTYSANGDTNSTRVFVDGETPAFGDEQGTLVRGNQIVAQGTYESVWEFRDIETTQTVEEIAGDVSRRMDAIRITYALKNKGTQEHMAGLRVMLDTLIGSNDGVPFIVPGSREIVTSAVTYHNDEIPDFIRALERPELADPGVVVDIGLRPAAGERPTEVAITHWPGSNAPYDYDREAPLGDDSAIGLYYAARALRPGEIRSMNFTYGLGQLSSMGKRNAKLGLTAGGPFHAGGKFWLVALVQNPQRGQSVRLTLPEGLALAPRQQAAKPVASDAAYTQLSWLIQVLPGRVGAAELKAVLEPGAIEDRQTIHIQPPDVRVMLVVRNPVESGMPFWVLAMVQNPQPGQTVRLLLPEQFKLAEREQAVKAVEPARAADRAKLSWLVRTVPGFVGTAELKALLEPGAREIRQSVTVEPRTTRLFLVAKGPAQAGKSFWVSALVQNPQAGQSVALNLPEGLQLASGETAGKAVSAGKDYLQINWLVRIDARHSGTVSLAATLLPQGVQHSCSLTIQAATLVQ